MKTANDKKIFFKFIIICVASLIAGAAMGFLSSMYDVSLNTAVTFIFDFLVKNSVWLICFNFIFVVLGIFSYVQSKALVKKALADQEEESFEKADEKLQSCLNYTNLITIFSFTAFGLMASGFSTQTFGEDKMLYTAIGLSAFIVILVIATWLQVSAINQTKLIYPEKNGNALDTKFRKQWFDSCDEAEKALIGAAAYKSYITMTYSFIAYFLAVLVLSMTVPVGPLPILIVGSLWLIQSVSYARECKKIQNKSTNKEKKER